MRVDRRFALSFPLSAALVLLGCDSTPSYEHATVHGKVTYKGAPLTFGRVLFIPVEQPKEGLPQPASGEIQPDGTYVLQSQEDAGAILGEKRGHFGGLSQIF